MIWGKDPEAAHAFTDATFARGSRYELTATQPKHHWHVLLVQSAQGAFVDSLQVDFWTDQVPDVVDAILDHRGPIKYAVHMRRERDR